MQARDSPPEGPATAEWVHCIIHGAMEKMVTIWAMDTEHPCEVEPARMAFARARSICCFSNGGPKGTLGPLVSVLKQAPHAMALQRSPCPSVLCGHLTQGLWAPWVNNRGSHHHMHLVPCCRPLPRGDPASLSGDTSGSEDWPQSGKWPRSHDLTLGGCPSLGNVVFISVYRIAWWLSTQPPWRSSALLALLWGPRVGALVPFPICCLYDSAQAIITKAHRPGSLNSPSLPVLGLKVPDPGVGRGSSPEPLSWARGCHSLPVSSCSRPLCLSVS